MELIKKTIGALDILSKQFTFKKAYIFGSILKKKKFYYDSDIDIAVSGLQERDFFMFMSQAADLLGRDVDIIQIEKHRLRDKIIKGGLLWKRRS